MCHHVLAARFLIFFYSLIVWVYVCVEEGGIYVCVSSEACGGHKRASDPLTLELQVGAGN